MNRKLRNGWTFKERPGPFLGAGFLGCVGLVLSVPAVFSSEYRKSYQFSWTGWVFEVVVFAVVAVGGLYFYFHFHNST
jgi:hypothetical protein